MKTGHGIAELIFLSRDGVSKVGGQLAAMKPEDRVFALPDAGANKTKATTAG